MKANTGSIMQGSQTRKQSEIETRGFRHYLAKIRAGITRYVTIDKDGIYKDPDWPHLWDHKR